MHRSAPDGLPGGSLFAFFVQNVLKIHIPDQPDFLMPVSYTHLDVYKRQRRWSVVH